MPHDGRHGNMLHTQSELRLCYFHEKRELQRLYSLEAGAKIGRLLATNLQTACDLSNACAMLFRAGLQGHFEPKMLNSLTRLGQLVVKPHLLAKEEYRDTYETDWSSIVLQSVALRPNPEPSASPSPSPDTPASDAEDEANSDSHPRANVAVYPAARLPNNPHLTLTIWSPKKKQRKLKNRKKHKK